MKKVFKYGMNFQAIGLAQMLYDPITKSILSKYGSLDFVAIFEMASKLVIQVRSISAATNFSKGSNSKPVPKGISNICSSSCPE